MHNFLVFIYNCAAFEISVIFQQVCNFCSHYFAHFKI